MSKVVLKNLVKSYDGKNYIPKESSVTAGTQTAHLQKGAGEYRLVCGRRYKAAWRGNPLVAGTGDSDPVRRRAGGSAGGRAPCVCA